MAASVLENGSFHPTLGTLDELFKLSKSMGYGDIHYKIEPKANLLSVIAIHSNKRGPALGGCRFLTYQSIGEALLDVLRLGRGMSYKAAICNLNYGGGKSIIIKPNTAFDREQLFLAYGKFVHEMGGRYISAIDSGSELTDMDVVAKVTPYVSCTSAQNFDPSPHTADGVLRGIQAAIKFQTGRDDLKNVHVAIQGLGHVGLNLAQKLKKHGALLTITDVDPQKVERVAHELDAKIVPPAEIYHAECDVFSPCALGAIINDVTIPQLKASIIVGSANNQLAESKHAAALKARNILYAPDYLVNSGGLINATIIYEHKSVEESEAKIDTLYDICLEIFQLARAQNLSPAEVADNIAAARLTG